VLCFIYSTRLFPEAEQWWHCYANYY